MRKSAAPSWRQRLLEPGVKRQRTDSGLPPASSVQSSTADGDPGPAVVQTSSTSSITTAAPWLSVPKLTGYKCPVPGAAAAAVSRTLGVRKLYSHAGADLWKSLGKTVHLDAASEPAAAAGPSDLLLYDPEAHADPAAAAATADGNSCEAAPEAAQQQDDQQQLQQQGSQQAAAAAATAAAGGGAGASPGKVYADQFLVDMLRPHQREGVKFIFECLTGVRQEGCFGAVLCDGMGLGKTFQTVASLWCLLTKGISGKPTCSKPLVLCPSSLVQNWGKELTHWLGQRVQPVVVDDTKAPAVKAALQDFKAINYQRRHQPKVLVMSYTTFRMHQAAVEKLGIDMVMCDEAHVLKNSAAQITQAVAGLATKRRLLLSGTPIQNDLSEFHAVFDVALPGLLGDLNNFRKQYESSILKGRDADATSEQVARGLERMNQLMEICNRFMLRRTSAVLKKLLPAKVEQVVFCKLAPLQLKLYNAFLISPAVRALLNPAPGSAASKRASSKARPGPTVAPGTYACITADPQQQQQQQQQQQAPVGKLAPLVAITALKKLCCHPDLIYNMCREGSNHTCQQQQLHCPATQSAARAGPSSAGGGRPGRASAAAAAATWQSQARVSSKSCSAAAAVARTQLHGFEGCQGLFHTPEVYPAFQPGQCQPYHSGKMMVLEALLKAIRQSEPTDKVVLISNYTEVLDVLQRMITAKGWSSLRLDGSCSVKQRQGLVDTFNDPAHPSFVFLVSSKAGGVGLNIIGGNRLVLFDASWNPADDAQAMARVWRQGQRKNVFIYRLLTSGSIEEKVFQRQLAKQGLSEALVDEVGQEVRTFSAEELRSLFRVDPTTPCDTHAAIKCSCDSSAATAAAKASAFAAAAARCQAAQGTDGSGAAEGGADKDPPEQQGLAAWAHLRSAADVPDPTWGHMGDWLRDKFVTYVFSDHVLQEPKEQQAAECGEEGVEEEEGGADGEQASGELCESGNQQAVSDHESDTEPDAW